MENKQLSMTWHYIFSIYQIVANAGAVLFALFCIFDIPDILFPLIGFSCYGIFCFITGIIMLCRKKIGYLFCQILNYIDVVLGILYTISAFFCWFYLIPTANPELHLNGLLIFLGFLLLLAGLSISIVHGISIKYFKKRREFFDK